MMIVVCVTLNLFPLLIYWVTEKRVLIYPLLLPLIDENSRLGYAIITSIQIVWVSMVGIGFVGSDGLMALLLIHIRPMVELFELDVAELNNVLVCRHNLKDSKAVELWLRNLAKQHQEMTELLTIYLFAHTRL